MIKLNWFIWIPRTMTLLYFFILTLLSFHLLEIQRLTVFQNIDVFDKVYSIIFFVYFCFGISRSPLRLSLEVFLMSLFFAFDFHIFGNPDLLLPISGSLILISLLYIISYFTKKKSEDSK